MGVSDFSKSEIVDFDKMIEGMEDQLVLLNDRFVDMFANDKTKLAQAGDTIWRPKPYIMRSFSGLDQTGNFVNATQLSVPASLDTSLVVPFNINPKDNRDASQRERLYQGARRKLASDINLAILNTVSDYGTLFVKRTGAASGFDDIAAIDTLLNEVGVPLDGRCVALSSGAYNGMANDLSKADRSFGNEISDGALRRAYVGMLSGIDTIKLDYAVRKAAAAGGGSLTVDTRTSAANFWVPKGTQVGTTGRNNVDNRYQTLTISSTTGVAAGDWFTIAGVNAVHHETKQSTGNLKSFRVISVPSSTTLVISPPIISAQGGSQAEEQYQNCTVAVADESATAAIVFLNTVTNSINPFWNKGALEVMPGVYEVERNNGIGQMSTTLSNGIQVLFTKQGSVNDLGTDYRLDTFFGVTAIEPEMIGAIMFSQT